MSKLYDLARVTVLSAPGTGSISLGPAIFGFITFQLAGVQNGDVVTYAINDGQQSEIGHGTYTSMTNSLSRDTVFSSTAGGINGLKISASATCQVFITIAAEDVGTLTTLAVGITAVTNGVNNGVFYDNAGVVGITGAGSTVNLGVANATSINGNFFTAGTYTLTGSAGKTLNFQDSLTLAGTDGTVMLFPGTSAVIARTDAGQIFTGAQSIISNSGFAFGVGPNGDTNPAFQIDASATSAAAGVLIVGAATGGTVQIKATDSGANTNLTLDAKGVGVITLGSVSTGGIRLNNAVALNSTINNVTITQPAASATLTIANTKTLTVSNSITLAGTDGTTVTFPTTSASLARTDAAQTFTGLQTFSTGVASTTLALGGATIGSNALAVAGSALFGNGLTSDFFVNVVSSSATALTVGLNGATNPAFQVDSSTALQVSGLKVTGSVTAGTVAITTTDSGANTSLSIDAKGAGQVAIGSASGSVSIARLIYGGVSLSNAVTGTGNMVLSSNPVLTTPALTGSSTGLVTLTSANAGASNFTITFPAITDTVVTLAATQTLTNKSISGAQINSGTVSGSFMAAVNLAAGNVNGGVTGLLPNANLANSTISGVSLGGTLAQLNFGAHLNVGGSFYNGSTVFNMTSDATAANTASTIMARDGSGQVAATTFTGALAGNATTATTASAVAVGNITGLGTGVATALGNATNATGGVITGTPSTWTPTPVNLTVVNGTGGVTYAGFYVIHGNVLHWEIVITPTGTATTASVANSTNFTLPTHPVRNSPGSSVDTNVGSQGTGVATPAGLFYTPTWGAVNAMVCLSGWYFTS